MESTDESRATPEERSRAYFGKHAARYVSSATHRDPEVLARVVDLAAPLPDRIALDVATGTGHTAFALAARAPRVLAVDLSSEMLAEARREARRRGIANVDLVVADARHLPAPDGGVGCVTCRRAAHHFSDIGAALVEMHRVLAPGGRLVIDDRSVPEDDAVDRIMNELDRLHDPSHVREYRPSAWRALLRGAGFEVDLVLPYEQERPIESLTEQARPQDVRRILDIIGSFDTPIREAFRLEEKGGRLFLRHWYVTIAARKE